jgi:TRAP-type C4-dicarboxylate transport system permease small subunit
MRYAFNNSPTWPEEASRYVMIWIVFIGTSQTIEKNSEIKIDLLGILLRENTNAKIINDIMTSSICFIISIFLTVLTAQFFNMLMETGQVAASFPYPNMAVMYSIIPISAIIMCVKYAKRIVELIHFYWVSKKPVPEHQAKNEA